MNELILALQRNKGFHYFAVSILLLVFYFPLLTSGFNNTDDFREIARANFEDQQRPTRILTTPHDSNRYRPFDRLLTLLTYNINGFNPLSYYVRNLGMHIIVSLLAGYLFASLFNYADYGSLMALLFGLHPSNTLVVGTAVTTKAFFGFFFLVTCLLWLHVWREKRPRLTLWLALVILSSIAVLFHDQGLSLLVIAAGVCLILWRTDKVYSIRWLLFGGTLVVAVVGVLLLGRSLAGVLGKSPALKPLGEMVRDFGFATVSIAAPIDHVLLLGPYTISRDNLGKDMLLRLLEAHWPQIVIFILGLLSVVGIFLLGLMIHRRSKNNNVLYIYILLILGVYSALAPVLAFATYSEMHNYVSIFFGLSLLLLSIRTLRTTSAQSLRRVSAVFLVGLIVSYSVATIYRITLLNNVSREYSQIADSILSSVPEPELNSYFLVYDDQKQVQGYSNYGQRGAASIDTRLRYLVQMIFNRSDLQGEALEYVPSQDELCQAIRREQPIYILTWQDQKMNRVFPSCPDQVQSETSMRNLIPTVWSTAF